MLQTRFSLYIIVGRRYRILRPRTVLFDGTAHGLNWKIFKNVKIYRPLTSSCWSHFPWPIKTVKLEKSRFRFIVVSVTFFLFCVAFYAGLQSESFMEYIVLRVTHPWVKKDIHDFHYGQSYALWRRITAHRYSTEVYNRFLPISNSNYFLPIRPCTQHWELYFVLNLKLHIDWPSECFSDDNLWAWQLPQSEPCWFQQKNKKKKVNAFFCSE